MARFTVESRERVREAVDFAEVVAAKTELRRSGATRLTGLCPFHEERSPSFGIDPVEKLYYCFGCQASGDLFRFVMDTEGLTFPEAVQSLADRYGVELEYDEEDPGAADARRRRERLLELLERTAAFYVRMLWESPEAAGARAYLAGRGLEEAVLRRYRVGWSPSRWDRVLLASRKAGYSEQELLDAGLARRGRQRPRLYDFFRARVMFPLADVRGRVLGFGGRALRDGQGPKYVNSLEGPLYAKRRQLFGADVARAPAARAGRVVLAEGYTDVLALSQAGVPEAVCIMGTSFTAEQAVELRRLAPAAVLCLDADAAGQAAALKASDVAAARGLELYVAAMPPGSDPADLLRSAGPEALRAVVDGAVRGERFRVEAALAAEDLGGSAGRDRALARAAAVIRPLPASAFREELVQLVAGRVGVSPELAAQLLASAPPPPAPARSGGDRGHDRAAAGGGAGRPDAAAPGGAAAPARPDVAGSGAAARAVLAAPERRERQFLAFVLALPEPGRAVLAALDLEEHFSSPLTRRAAALLRAHPEQPARFVPDDDPELATLLAELVVRAGGEPVEPAELELQRLQLELARVERALASARAGGDPATTALAREHAEIQSLMRAAQR